MLDWLGHPFTGRAHALPQAEPEPHPDEVRLDQLLLNPDANQVGREGGRLVSWNTAVLPTRVRTIRPVEQVAVIQEQTFDFAIERQVFQAACVDPPVLGCFHAGSTGTSPSVSAFFEVPYSMRSLTAPTVVTS